LSSGRHGEDRKRQYFLYDHETPLLDDLADLLYSGIAFECLFPKMDGAFPLACGATGAPSACLTRGGVGFWFRVCNPGAATPGVVKHPLGCALPRALWHVRVPACCAGRPCNRCAGTLLGGVCGRVGAARTRVPSRVCVCRVTAPCAAAFPCVGYAGSRLCPSVAGGCVCREFCRGGRPSGNLPLHTLSFLRSRRSSGVALRDSRPVRCLWSLAARTRNRTGHLQNGSLAGVAHLL